MIDTPLDGLSWSEQIHDILTGDLTAAVSYCTPAGGAVVTPVAPVGTVDRARGIVSFTTSLGFARKLEHILRDPHISLCYTTREHGFSSSRSAILVQGKASVLLAPSRARLDALTPAAARFFGQQPSGRFWDWLLREFLEFRAIVDVTVERVTSWPDQVMAGQRTVAGRPWPDDPPSQRPPANGSGPRVDIGALARDLSSLPHRFVAYRGADGFPIVAPAQFGGSGTEGLCLVVPEGVLPDGSRRAGLLAHRFGPQCSGLVTLNGTGWLDSSGGVARFAPHTVKKISTPPTRFAQRLGSGLLAKHGYYRARNNGELDHLRSLASANDQS